MKLRSTPLSLARALVILIAAWPPGAFAASEADPTCPHHLLALPAGQRPSRSQIHRVTTVITGQSGSGPFTSAVFAPDGLIHQLTRAARAKMALTTASVNAALVAPVVGRLDLTHEQRVTVVRQIAARDFALFLNNWESFKISKDDAFSIWMTFGPRYVGVISDGMFSDPRSFRPIDDWAHFLPRFEFSEDQRARLALRFVMFMNNTFFERLLGVMDLRSSGSLLPLMRSALPNMKWDLAHAIARHGGLNREDWLFALAESRREFYDPEALPSFLREHPLPLTREDRLALLRAYLFRSSQPNEASFSRHSVLRLCDDFGITRREDILSLREYFTESDAFEREYLEHPVAKTLLARMLRLSGKYQVVVAERILGRSDFPFDQLVATPRAVAEFGYLLRSRSVDWAIRWNENSDRVVTMIARVHQVLPNFEKWPEREAIERLHPSRRDQVYALLASYGVHFEAPPPALTRAPGPAPSTQRITRVEVAAPERTRARTLERASRDADFVQNYGFARFNLPERRRILRAMLQDFPGESKYLPHDGFEELPLDFRLDYILQWLALNPSPNIHLPRLFLSELRMIDLPLLLQLATDPLQALQKAEHPLTLETPSARMADVVRSFAKKFPATIGSLDVITEIPNTGAMLNLVSLEAIAHVRARKPKPFSNPISLVGEAFGFAPEIAEVSTLARGDLTYLVTLAFEYFRFAGWGSLRKIDFDPALFSMKKNHARLLQFLGLNRDALSLKRSRDEMIGEIVGELGGRLSPENLDAAVTSAKERLVTAVRDLFGETSMNLTYEDLARLENEWGDLQPIFTLLARYRGQPNWREEIPVLARIFKHSLNGTFQTYKFHGDPTDDLDQAEAKTQLGILKPKQIAVLGQVHAHVGVFDGSTGGSAPLTSTQRMSNAREVIRTNLIPNLTRAGLSVVSNPLVEESLAAAMTSSHPLQWASNIALPGREAATLGGLASHLGRASDLSQMTFLTKTALALIQKHGIPNFTEAEQARQDLNAILALVSANQQKGERAILFVTTLHHPKSLLATGDLVPAASCQNYKYGSVIETLPGYVIDANTLPVVGYPLTASQFNNGQGFEEVFAAVSDGERVEGKLDEIKKTIEFRWRTPTGERRVVTREIPYAQHRQVLKIGSSVEDERRPALFAERAYTQVHFAEDAIAAATNRLVKALARKIGAVTNVPLLIRASRNVGGQYSDAGGGVKKTDYVIEP